MALKQAWPGVTPIEGKLPPLGPPTLWLPEYVELEGEGHVFVVAIPVDVGMAPHL
jgi:hypothetical protein